jgi:hypothetical protein
MSVKKPALVLAAGALAIAGAALPASAQDPSCPDLYARTMAIYQTAGPQSQQYAEILNFYSAHCLSGPPAPAYPYPYGYAQPVPIDPGAAIVGGIVGGVIGGALDGDRRRHRDDRRDRRDRRDHRDERPR